MVITHFNILKFNEKTTNLFYSLDEYFIEIVIKNKVINIDIMIAFIIFNK